MILTTVATARYNDEVSYVMLLVATFVIYFHQKFIRNERTIFPLIYDRGHCDEASPDSQFFEQEKKEG